MLCGPTVPEVPLLVVEVVERIVDDECVCVVVVVVDGFVVVDVVVDGFAVVLVFVDGTTAGTSVVELDGVVTVVVVVPLLLPPLDVLRNKK
jgi:hypothetical protein